MREVALKCWARASAGKAVGCCGYADCAGAVCVFRTWRGQTRVQSSSVRVVAEKRTGIRQSSGESVGIKYYIATRQEALPYISRNQRFLPPMPQQ